MSGDDEVRGTNGQIVVHRRRTLLQQTDCIDNRISRQEDPLGRDALQNELALGGRGWGEVDCSDASNRLPVRLLGERRRQISAAQPRLYVRNRDLPVEGRQSTRERR